MRKLYCFDFDGTITTKDSMFLFLKFYDLKKYWISYCKHLPLFILLKLKLISAEKVKKSFISGVLLGESQNKLNKKAKLFFEKYNKQIIRKNALDFIQNIDKNTHTCLLVTASLDIWTWPFAEYLGFQLVATLAEFKKNQFTGNFASKNCNEKEKVNRIQNAIKGMKFDKIIAFGDTSGDLPMLNWAHESHYRFFH